MGARRPHRVDEGERSIRQRHAEKGAAIRPGGGEHHQDEDGGNPGIRADGRNLRGQGNLHFPRLVPGEGLEQGSDETPAVKPFRIGHQPAMQSGYRAEIRRHRGDVGCPERCNGPGAKRESPPCRCPLLAGRRSVSPLSLSVLVGHPALSGSLRRAYRAAGSGPWRDRGFSCVRGMHAMIDLERGPWSRTR